MNEAIELKLLSKATEEWDDGILGAFRLALRDHDRAEAQAKAESSLYRIASETGLRYRNQNNDGWVNSVERAGCWTYAARPALGPKQKYVTVEVNF
jgi:lysozyme family protein